MNPLNALCVKPYRVKGPYVSLACTSGVDAPQQSTCNLLVRPPREVLFSYCQQSKRPADECVLRMYRDAYIMSTCAVPRGHILAFGFGMTQSSDRPYVLSWPLQAQTRR